MPEKREKIENIAMMLKAALEAETLVGLKMNVEKKDLKEVLLILPSLKNPTINNLSDDSGVAIEIIVDHKKVRDLIPALKRAGASGIVEYPLSKVIY